MANEEQLAILRQGVDVWNTYRADHLNLRPDLLEAKLFGADLRGANLQGANLFGADLRGANLQGAKLFGADLIEADLAGANFQGANLQGANLQRADLARAVLQEGDLARVNLFGVKLFRANLQRTNLFRADLQGAHLDGANLRGADLQGANLRGADLQGADFQGANLQGTYLAGAKLFRANMQEANIGWTVFADVDLRAIQNLESVQHKGPSTIGIDTLYASHSDIPEVFLRGCGVPNAMIVYAHSLVLAERPIDYYSCFISYSHADKSFARRLHDALQGRGIRCWLDEHQVLPGHSIYDEVDRGIRLWDKILLCASESSLKSWWVDNEIDKAFVKEQQFTKERGRKIRALIPLNLDDALWQWQDGKADQVRSRLAADFTGWEQDNTKFERQFERLVQALRTDEGREEPPKPKL